MGLKKSAGRGSIADDFEAFKPRRLKRKGFVHFGEDPPPHGGGEEPEQRRLAHDVVLPGLLARVHPVLPLPGVGMLHAGVHVAARFPDVDQGVTQVRGQHTRNEQDGGLGVDGQGRERRQVGGQGGEHLVHRRGPLVHGQGGEESAGWG